MNIGKRASGVSERRSHWRKVIGEQQASGLSIRGYCREHAVAEHPFYMWRKRLRQETAPVRFVLVETANLSAHGSPAALELVLGSGHILRIGPGVDAATLRRVVDALSAEA